MGFSASLVDPSFVPDVVPDVPVSIQPLAKRSAGRGFEGQPFAKAMRVEQSRDELEADALAEVYVQLGRPESNGRVWFDVWRERFGSLARNPRAFIEAHADKFQIIPGRGNSYT